MILNRYCQCSLATGSVGLSSIITTRARPYRAPLDISLEGELKKNRTAFKKRACCINVLISFLMTFLGILSI